MISDILADDAQAIREYLKDMPEVYSDPAIRRDIDDLLAKMDALRIKLDTPPSQMDTP